MIARPGQSIAETRNELSIPKSLTPAKISAPSSLRFSQMNLDERMRLCTFMASSTTVPKALQGNPANIYYIAERGDRIGLSATESISCVMVVNGVTSLWGDMMLALCRASDQWDSAAFDEWIEVDGTRVTKDFDNDALQKAFTEAKMIVAYCKAKRVDAPDAIVRSFSVQDAVIAELDQKPGPWRTAPKRMIQMRARSWALRDGFSDVLFGLYSREEADDIAPDTLSQEQQIEAKSQPDTKGTEIMKSDMPTLIKTAQDTGKAVLQGQERPQPVDPAPDEQTPAPDQKDPNQGDLPIPGDAPTQPEAAIAQLVDAKVDQLRKLTQGGARLMKIWQKHKLPTAKFLKVKASELLPEPALALFGVDVEQAIAELTKK